jgi:hypothetical protein
MATKEAASNVPERELPVGPLVAACLVPGGGHFWLKRWGRGAILLAAVGVLFVAGLFMDGRFFRLEPGNMVETLGFLGDLCSGVLFLAAKFTGHEGQVVASPIADYGTKFLLVAGLLNVLCVLDAYDIAVGNKD